MQLWVYRSEDRDWLGRPLYRLTLGLEVNRDERVMLGRHLLADAEVWASPAALALDGEAEAALEKGSALPFGGRRAIRKRLGWSVAGLWLARQALREGRVSVGELLAGKVLEAREVSELVAAEQGVRAGFDALAAKLRMLEGYEVGDEELINPVAPDGGTPARDWARMAR